MGGKEYEGGVGRLVIDLRRVCKRKDGLGREGGVVKNGCSESSWGKTIFNIFNMWASFGHERCIPPLMETDLVKDLLTELMREELLTELRRMYRMTDLLKHKVGFSLTSCN